MITLQLGVGDSLELPRTENDRNWFSRLGHFWLSCLSSTRSNIHFRRRKMNLNVDILKRPSKFPAP